MPCSTSRDPSFRSSSRRAIWKEGRSDVELQLVRHTEHNSRGRQKIRQAINQRVCPDRNVLYLFQCLKFTRGSSKPNSCLASTIMNTVPTTTTRSFSGLSSVPDFAASVRASLSESTWEGWVGGEKHSARATNAYV